MILPIIALLLFGAPSTTQNTVVSNETAVAAPQKEKTIPLDINNDKGLKAKFPDAVKFYALQVEVTVGEGNRALTTETQGAFDIKEVLTKCSNNELDTYAISKVSIENFAALTYNRVVIEVTQLVYLNKNGLWVAPEKSSFYTTSVKV